MRMILICSVAPLAIALASSAFAQEPTKIQSPKINGQDVDHCADINSLNDCSPAGQAKAAINVCSAYGFRDQVDSHWRESSGTASHFIAEYDMHAGEVGGRWVLSPTTGVFDWVECKK
jgi:hypothetical protein